MRTAVAAQPATTFPFANLPLPDHPTEAPQTSNEPWLRMIAGDASDRKFYRLEGAKIGAICMRFPKWQGGYGGDPISWLGMHKALVQMGLPVPEVLLVDEEKACIWTEDFGDNFLNCAMNGDLLDARKPSCAESINHYLQALDLLVMAQYPQKPVIEHPALKLSFDTEKLMFELRFFVTHFLNGFLGMNATEENPEWAPLFNDFRNLSQWLDRRSRVLCHRDYHVRNVMVVDGRAKWIDFQDARMGPHAYDVVSLVRDSYIKIPSATRKILYSHYFTKMNAARTSLSIPALPLREFDIEVIHMGLQRNIKAIGSFGYLATTKGKPGYLSYVKSTLETLCDPMNYQAFDIDLQREYPAVMRLIFDLQSGTLRSHLNETLTKFGQ
jgi:aminoglycoside/choline kinase family phosphotransferase